MARHRSYIYNLLSKSLLLTTKISPIIGISFAAGWILKEFNNKVNHHSYDKLGFISNRKDCNFIADAAEMVIDSVVDIRVSLSNTKLFSSGSGIVIDDSGLILTNAHVVSDFIEDGIITITTLDNQEFPGFCFAMDLQSDLALIKVLDLDSSKVWQKAILGSETKTRVGEWVLAIGSPLGLYHSVAVGIISSTSRKSIEIGNEESPIEYIQTDCNVHHGNSGGPLINIHGEVIG